MSIGFLTFEEKYELADSRQRESYVRIIEQFKEIDLSNEEKRYLLWLAGWDFDTEKVFISLFKKLKLIKD